MGEKKRLETVFENQSIILSFSHLKGVLLPSQKVSSPLHTPSDLHSLTFEPFKLNPSSQVNDTLLGYVVRFPRFVPFKGILMEPQSFAINLKII